MDRCCCGEGVECKRFDGIKALVRCYEIDHGSEKPWMVQGRRGECELHDSRCSPNPGRSIYFHTHCTKTINYH